MVNAPCHHNGSAQRKSTSFLSFATKGFHALKTGAGLEESHGMDRYETLGFLQSRLPGLVNVIDNVKRLQAEERRCYTNIEGSQPRRVLAEQKSTDLLREIICRLSKPGDLVDDLFGGTFSTALVCMKTPDEQQRVLIGCEKDEECFAEASKWCLAELPRMLLQFGNNETTFPRAVLSSVIEKNRLVVFHLLTRLEFGFNWTFVGDFQHCLCYDRTSWRC